MVSSSSLLFVCCVVPVVIATYLPWTRSRDTADAVGEKTNAVRRLHDDASDSATSGTAGRHHQHRRRRKSFFRDDAVCGNKSLPDSVNNGCFTVYRISILICGQRSPADCRWTNRYIEMQQLSYWDNSVLRSQCKNNTVSIVASSSESKPKTKLACVSKTLISFDQEYWNSPL